MPGRWYFRGALLLLGSLLLSHFILRADNHDLRKGSLHITTYSKQFVNVHLVCLDGRYLLIDAGLVGDWEGLLRFLRKQGVSPTDLDYLVLTHAHPDHAGNAAMLQQEYGVPIIAGAADSSIIAQQGEDPHLCVYKWPGRIVQKTIAAQRYHPFQPDIEVTDLYQLEYGDRTVTIKCIGGHTPGSLAIFIDQNVFVGDLLKGSNLVAQRPAFHLFLCDPAANLSDLETIAQWPSLEYWFTGHLGPLRQVDVLNFIEKQSRLINAQHDE